MTEAPHLSNDPAGGDWADRMEQAVLDAAVERAPALGWNGRMVRAAQSPPAGSFDRCGASVMAPA